MGFLLSTITCSEATPMAKACGVVLFFDMNKHSGIILPSGIVCWSSKINDCRQKG